MRNHQLGGWRSERTTFGKLPIGALFMHGVMTGDLSQKVDDRHYMKAGKRTTRYTYFLDTDFVSHLEWLGPEAAPKECRDLLDKSGLAAVPCAT